LELAVRTALLINPSIDQAAVEGTIDVLTLKAVVYAGARTTFAQVFRARPLNGNRQRSKIWCNVLTFILWSLGATLTSHS
jgi:hypothetical protein